MKFKLMIIAASILSSSISLSAMESIQVDDTFNKVIMGKYFEYMVDIDKNLTLDQVIQEKVWTESKADSLNFGFSQSAYWFRFTIDNKTAGPMNLFFEVANSFFKYVYFYRQVDGKYIESKTGSMLPFSQREVEDKNFIFLLKDGPGLHTYYLRIEPRSAMNFIPALMSQKSYLSRIQYRIPILWLFFGFMIIMVVYNLFIFSAIRDMSYLYYILFIGCFVIFLMTFNGYSFQYLWPNSVWWDAKSLPFFMCMTISASAMFIREIMARQTFKTMSKILLYVVVIPAFAWSFISILFPYYIAIKVSAFVIGSICLILFSCNIYGLIRKSRMAVFVFAAYTGLGVGINLYVMKTVGKLPDVFITEWGVQIGASIVVIVLSLALADKIEIMRKELEKVLQKEKENEKTAKERAAYFEGIVKTATSLSQEFVKVVIRLQSITQQFGNLSMEQASTSEEMSSTFEELAASVESIYNSIISQNKESGKTKQFVDDLNNAQKELVKESEKVDASIRSILSSTSNTGESLKKMNNTMNIINAGGKEINQFISMIDDISDRINLLSLNAAIEAARAGDYGRGFAVVADEIGKLAQATSDNSKEISKQISKIISDIEAGTNIVASTKESTDVIFHMVNSISSGINSLREMMMKQNQALEMVIEQTKLNDTMSKDILISTNEQKSAMSLTQKTIDRLSEMAQEIAQSNGQIIDLAKVIYDKSVNLNSVISEGA